MKLLFVFALAFIANTVLAQVRDAKEITWYGLDFTHVKLIGSEVTDFTDIDDIVERQFEGLNMLLFNEKEKYNIERIVRKQVEYDIAKAIELNKLTLKEGLVTLSSNRISDEEMSSIVNQYTNEKGGVGMLFVVENMIKSDSKIQLYVVFFDAATGSLLFEQPIEGMVKNGIGFRNWWASGFLSALQIAQKGYPRWDLK